MRRALLFAVLAGLALTAAAPAGATIVPQRSIAGVELSMAKPQVRGVLGEPNNVVQGTNKFGAYTIFEYRRLRIVFQGRTNVTAIRTTRRNERTVHGIGVGSTRAEVRENVARVRCGRRQCVRGRFLPGRRVTVFRLVRGKVAQVIIGFVID